VIAILGASLLDRIETKAVIKALASSKRLYDYVGRSQDRNTPRRFMLQKPG